MDPHSPTPGAPRPRRRLARAALLAVAAATLGAADPARTAPAGSLGVSLAHPTGAPLAGAEVTLRPAAPGAAAPPAVLSDASGRAVFVGLAAGEWSLEATHPDFMTLSAWIEIRPGKPARQIFAAQVATPGSHEPMRVAYFLPKGPPSPPRPPRQVPPDSLPPREVPREVPPDSQPTAAPPRETPLGRPPVEAPGEVRSGEVPPDSPPAPVAPLPVPAPPPAPPPAPEPARPPVSTPEGVPAGPTAAPMAPIPSPPPAAPPAPVGEPAVPSLERPRAADVRSPRQGNCPGCRGAEWAVVAEADVTASPSPPTPRQCGGAAGAPGLGGQGDLERALAAARAPAALVSAPGPCRSLALSLPAGARYRGYRFEAEDLRSGGDCLAGQDCPVGEFLFLDHPRRVARPREGDILVATALARTARDRVVRARFTVYFEPAAPAPEAGSR